MADNADKDGMPCVLTPEELDAIGEIMNISMGSAATAVSTMLEKQVTITTPQLVQGPFNTIDSKDLEPALIVKIRYVEGISGTNVTMLRRRDMQIILNLLMGNDMPGSEEDFEFDDMSMSAACEVMNQMMGASATALSEILEIPINISTPDAVLVQSKEEIVHTFFDIESDESVVAISFKMIIKDVLNTTFSCFLPTSLASSIVRSVSEPKEEIVAPAAAPFVEAPIAAPAMQQQAPPPMMEQSPAPAWPEQPAPAPMAQPPMQQPVQEQPVMQQPVMQQPVMQQPVPQQQPMAQPPMQQPAPQPPMQQQPMQQQPAPRQPVQFAAQAPQQAAQQPPAQQMMPQMAPQYGAPTGYPPNGQMAPQYAQQQQYAPYPPYGQAPSPYPPQAAGGAGQGSVQIRNAEFPDFSKQVIQTGAPSISNMGLLMGVHLDVSVVIGRAKRKIKDILEFGQGAVVELDKQTGAPAEIVVNGQLLAYGEIIVVGDNFGIRVTEIVGTKELLESLEPNF